MGGELEGKLIRERMRELKEKASLALSEQGSSTKSLAEFVKLMELQVMIDVWMVKVATTDKKWRDNYNGNPRSNIVVNGIANCMMKEKISFYMGPDWLEE
ncbi:hypothetical protein TIFTF001_053406 [Ficus carica]|uniref:Uncharacterized protein n=1 Tax=Ficus carica TaxID=3494 RepID=A0AA88EHJ9_FICCA|nr:hypothetical protein TIFTF001_053401 [Ficus carica]GMN71448.1 hypothetical protein TIFTF001_053402 [Ficus carica]GMN71461.1 hypothetical protein TIFTF001_053405 [Ficus carica]GMN71466.1 hypothetical protein TIFTF001_053406 [Ficus carica]